MISGLRNGFLFLEIFSCFNPSGYPLIFCILSLIEIFPLLQIQTPFVQKTFACKIWYLNDNNLVSYNFGIALGCYQTVFFVIQLDSCLGFNPSSSGSTKIPSFLTICWSKYISPPPNSGLWIITISQWILERTPLSASSYACSLRR